MIKGMKIKVAAAVLAGIVSVGGAAQAYGATSVATRYACQPPQNLVIERDGKIARVTFIDRSYELRRKPSSIGIKYESDHAALIIDGRSAVFVAEDRLQLGTCIEAMAVASSH